MRFRMSPFRVLRQCILRYGFSRSPFRLRSGWAIAFRCSRVARCPALSGMVGSQTFACEGLGSYGKSVSSPVFCSIAVSCQVWFCWVTVPMYYWDGEIMDLNSRVLQSILLSGQ